MPEYTEIAGKLAGFFSFLAYLPFLVAIFRRQARPNRASWIIWTFVSSVIAFSYYQAGARDTAIVPAVYGVCSSVIAILSFWYGEGGWTKFDRRCLMAAGVGAVCWWLFDSPAVAFFSNLSIDIIGALPTIKKAYHDPSSEDRLTWMFFLFGGVANTIAIDQWTSFTVVVYPLAMIILIGLIAGLVWFRPRPQVAAVLS